MRHLYRTQPIIFLSAFFIFGKSSAQEPKPVRTLADLQQQLSAHLAQPKFDAALWGVKVVSLVSGKVIFEQNSQKLFSPASNSKLYTVALALDPAGNVYVAGTTTSASLTGTPGSAFPSASGTSTSFVARFDPSLNPLWLTFTGSDKMAATAIAATATGVFLTGSIFFNSWYQELTVFAELRA